MIHVCFCFQDKTGRYAKFAGTTILSMFENSSPPPSTCVHILHDNTLTQDNREKFIYLAGRYGQLVKFYNVEELCADKIAEIKKLFPTAAKTRFTIGMFYRLFIPHVLSLDIEKAIYLDTDIIVNLDISELWRIELGDKILGVVSEKMLGDPPELKPVCIDGHVKPENYFNSGVLLMNLKLMRNEYETVINGMKFISENPRYRTVLDQTLLNYCFSSRSLMLPIKFNQIAYLWFRRKETNIGQGIYHLTGDNPQLNLKNYFNRLWMNYFIRTPWFNEDALDRLYDGYLKIRNDLETQTAKTSAIVSGKTRAFFVEPAKIESIKKFFLIRDDELIIPAENEDSIQKLLDAMKTTQGKCVFFIMPKKFLKENFPFDRLTKEGFVQDKDFLKGWEYLSDSYGNPFNTHPLIQAM